MPLSASPAECPRATMFNVVRANDPAELDSRSRVSERLPGSSRRYRYQLCDRALWQKRFDSPILSVAIRSAGPILASHGESRFATEVAVEGDDSDVYGISMPQQGSMTLLEHGEATTAKPCGGLVYRLGDGARLLTGDDSVRANLFIQATEVERGLEHMLDQRLRRPLVFSPFLDWGSGLAASLRAQLDFVMREFERPDGIAENPVALAATTDLLVTLVLRAARHSHSEQLNHPTGCAVPAYVHRAEEFMRAHAAQPLRMSDVAAAAGCSVRTLGAVFQGFRGRTPLAALHAIRLEQVHAELSRGAADASVAAVARRHGFTNASRFAAAFRRRFGESAQVVLRRASPP